MSALNTNSNINNSSSSNVNNSNSCVETPAAPEWLSKLENRCEKLKKSKLGHEAGAGAPCVECGDKCPGLDLHFWRKVCRNCKCRKDQHMCNDDDLSGWAQFEILGQIRSKPAFIKIKALANQPIQVDWVPPNATADVVSDYMDKLGTTQIPVAGSDAALKRKQQLEFQVPPHDLDATLCDNLTESEAQQLQQYVQKIRENCVGQGNVIRVGSMTHAMIGHLPQTSTITNDNLFKPEYAEVFATLGHETVQDDDVINELLSSDKLTNAILSNVKASYPKMFIAYTEPITDSMAEFEEEPLLTKPARDKLCGLNRAAVKSLVHNGSLYDKILAALKSKNLDISRDPKLGPIDDFRHEYVTNPQFKQQINAITPVKELPKPQFATPIKTLHSDLAFNSPLPIKNPIKTRYSAQMRQDTPMRKVTFGGVNQVIYDCGLPTSIDYSKDPIFAGIVNAEPLKQALQKARTNDIIGIKTPVVLSLRPLTPDYMMDSILTATSKEKLNNLQLDSNAIQSVLLNAPFYDQFFNTLHERGLDYSQCKLLEPIAKLREQFAKDKPFYDDVSSFVAQMPTSFDVVYGNPQQIFKAAALSNSHSNDSGFDSKPTTPSHSVGGIVSNDDLNASSGRFMSIPGIEEMNMYPSVMPSNQMIVDNLPQVLEQLQLNNEAAPAPTLPCLDCALPINFGEVAVKAERAGKEIAWHPACFKCHTCRELLADLVYFFHGGQVYCGRDLAIKLKIPRCKACDELIFTKEYTAAEGATFHIKHFCCFQCDTPLAGQQYIPDEKSNMPLCLQCYDTYYAAACQRCQRAIGPADQGVAWGNVHWHDTCFICAGLKCDKSLIGGRFCVKQNMPFCSPACVRSVIN